MCNKVYIGIAEEFLRERHSKAKASFISGSMMRNDFKPHSDIDMVILYGDGELPRAYRESLIYKGRMMECFVHNESSIAYVWEQERKSGYGVLVGLVASGLVFPDSSRSGKSWQRKASGIVEKGPLPMKPEDVDSWRYRISDALDDLRDERPPYERYACLSLLYMLLGDFYLRANRRWSGRGKALPRLLKAYDAKMARRYHKAFGAAYVQDDVKPVIRLAEGMLEPFGGILWAGYKSFMPAIVRS